MKKFFCTLFLIAASAASAEPAPYTLSNTEVLSLRSAALKRDYDIFVSLPESYKNSNKHYPVVFVADANYAFPVGRALAARVGAHGRGLEEFILIGLSYARGDSPEYSRRRDYTPGPSLENGLRSDMPGRTPAFGEAEGYRRFIADEVFPLVAQHYRADMRRTIFSGHSYGSLLGLHILFTEPSMFSHYILGSPSLWYGKNLMFEREKAYAAGHKDLKANVFFAVGGLETGKGEDNMVGDLKRFTAALTARRYPGLRVASTVLADEDHLSVAPLIMTRGLKWALPPQR
ncbi:MAG TPA: alpha/beta hydrolase-fold protein [Telluria sp.]|nr:alpha/beta hydrolase-fold protein [Telluria sp.]